MDSAASTMGISRSRAVVYINDCMEGLSSMAALYVVISNTDEAKAVEEGFQLVAGFPGVVEDVDETLIAKPLS
ncbi:hypothetical protein GN958_ATG01479 [Phytophthora infestans]|uniref:Uncharacterized protein n=1 Tax=Phytophthora infestans TaxID=4787 RepID=A0A8S9VDB4_PHYIN|nr:hypothetical protein GN958_ATG01479 [Phytophthora infestans]